MRRHFTAALLAGLSATGLAVAQDTGAQPAQEAAPAEAAAASTYDASTVLATVNGVDITLGHAIVMRDRLPPQYQNLPDDVLMQGIVDQLVDQTLLAAKASASPDDDPREVKLHLENERRGTLAAREVQKSVGLPLDESEVQAAYDARTATFEPQQEFRAAHILVASEEEAKALQEKLAAGEDFAALATANSTDPGSAPQGGALGWFGKGQMVPEFEAAVESLEPGQVSAPVQSQFGWHIVKLEETRESSPPPLEQLRPEIENALRQEKLDAELQTLRSGAEISRPEAAVAPEAIRRSELVQN